MMTVSIKLNNSDLVVFKKCVWITEVLGKCQINFCGNMSDLRSESISEVILMKRTPNAAMLTPEQLQIKM